MLLKIKRVRINVNIYSNFRGHGQTGRWGRRGRGLGTGITGRKNKQALLLLQKGYLQKYGNMKGVISSSNWDGEEGGDEDVELEEELGRKITNDHYYYYKKIKGCSQKYGNNKGVTSGSGNYLGKVGSYEKRYAN